MATMRELTTVLDFRTDLSGLKVYEQSIERVKGLAMEVGKMFGLYFAVDKIGEYVGEVVKAGREMTRINAQIAMMARSQDDATAATNELFIIAQKVGIEYDEIAKTYKGFLVDVQDSKISQEELLTATENVFKALRVGRNSAEEMSAAVAQIERGLRMGRFERRTIGRLIETPGLQQVLLAASGQKNIDSLRALAKEGKITGEQMIEWLSKPNARLQADFEKLPRRIDWVFNDIKNSLSAASAELWKMSNGFSALGDIIWWAFTKASNAVKSFINVLGGLRQTLEVVGIAFALVLGPYAIRQAILLAASSWSIVLPWLAIGAAVAAVAIGLQDLWYWFQGKPSLIGTWVGSYKDVKEGITKQFDDMPIVQFGKAMKDFATGDFTGGITELTKALGDPKKLLTEIMELVLVGIPLAFIGWESLRFTGILGALNVLRKSIIGVKTDIEATAATAEKTGKEKPGDKPGATPAARPWGGRIARGIGWAGMLAGLASQLGLLGEGRLADAGTGAGLGSMTGGWIGTIAGAIGGFLWKKPDFLPDWMNKSPGQLWKDSGIDKSLSPGDTPIGTFGWIAKKLGLSATGNDAPGAQSSNQPGDGRGAPVQPIALGLTDMAQLMSALTYGSMPWDVGAMARTTVPPNITTTINPGYNINVTMQPDEKFVADMIQQKVEATQSDLAGKVARSIQDATPRTERQTQ